MRDFLFFSFSVVLFFSCEHLQTTPKNYRGGNCDPNTVYYVNDVEPILVSNCGIKGCHDATSAEEGVVINSYENIIRTAGIKKGNGIKSELIKIMRGIGGEVMPPSGKLDDASISKISKWIDQGALNNQCIAGCDSSSFTYSKAISNIIEKNCIGCHSSSNNKVLLNTYTDVKKAADDGRLWGSINHFYGYQPMPSINTHLSECEINKIRNWIGNGAKND